MVYNKDIHERLRGLQLQSKLIFKSLLHRGGIRRHGVIRLPSPLERKIEPTTQLGLVHKRMREIPVSGLRFLAISNMVRFRPLNKIELLGLSIA